MAKFYSSDRGIFKWCDSMFWGDPTGKWYWSKGNVDDIAKFALTFPEAKREAAQCLVPTSQPFGILIRQMRAHLRTSVYISGKRAAEKALREAFPRHEEPPEKLTEEFLPGMLFFRLIILRK